MYFWKWFYVSEIDWLLLFVIFTVFKASEPLFQMILNSELNKEN